MLFHRAHTNAAVCSPARKALLTGAFNWKFGTYNHPDQASAVSNDPFPDVVTYPSILREGGYRLGYCGKWHTSTVRIPTDFGFHEIGAPNRYKGRAREKLIRDGWAPLDRRRRRQSVRMVKWPGSEPFGLWGYSEGEVEETELFDVAGAGVDMIRRFSGGGALACRGTLPGGVSRLAAAKVSRTATTLARFRCGPTFTTRFMASRTCRSEKRIPTGR